MIPGSSIPIPPLRVDGFGALVITASPSSSVHDFDFLVGDWKLRNRKLKSRLTHSDEWIAFDSRVEMHQILGGAGTSTSTPTSRAASQAFSTDEGKTLEWNSINVSERVASDR